VLGFPASWFDDINVEPLRWLVHPVRQSRRWSRRRRASRTGCRGRAAARSGGQVAAEPGEDPGPAVDGGSGAVDREERVACARTRGTLDALPGL